MRGYEGVGCCLSIQAKKRLYKVQLQKLCVWIFVISRAFFAILWGLGGKGRLTEVVPLSCSVFSLLFSFFLFFGGDRAADTHAFCSLGFDLISPQPVPQSTTTAKLWKDSTKPTVFVPVVFSLLLSVYNASPQMALCRWPSFPCVISFECLSIFFVCRSHFFFF